MINLKSISLQNNALSGFIPPEIGKLVNLEQLALFNNNLSGSIPPEIGNLVSLKELLLFCAPSSFDVVLPPCSISGSIPPEIGNLVNLEHLNLYNNQITGTIPDEIGKLSNLIILNLSRNMLSGPIPKGIGRLTSITNLNLSTNLLSGAIPPEIGQLTTMTHAWFPNNKLTGTIPSEIGNLESLRWLLLQNNLLSGPVPLSFASLSSLQIFYARGSENNVCIPAMLSGWYDAVPGRDKTPLPVCPEPPTSSETEEIPATFSLEQNYPNPFNPSTTIEYALDAPGYVELAVYNMAGVKVTTLVREYQIAGRHTAVWHSDVPSGTYLYRLVADGRSTTRYMTLVR